MKFELDEYMNPATIHDNIPAYRCQNCFKYINPRSSKRLCDDCADYLNEEDYEINKKES
jgi:rRNA maturation endonuclease Nob1